MFLSFAQEALQDAGLHHSGVAINGSCQASLAATSSWHHGAQYGRTWSTGGCPARGPRCLQSDFPMQMQVLEDKSFVHVSMIFRCSGFNCLASLKDHGFLSLVEPILLSCELFLILCAEEISRSLSVSLSLLTHRASYRVAVGPKSLQPFFGSRAKLFEPALS